MPFHRHIGLALLGCSLVLFLLWAMPYITGVDGFQLAASASADVTLAPEHTQLESQIATLQTQYASKDGAAGIPQVEKDLLETVGHIFQDENPDGELLRGDAAYLAAIYLATQAKPCGTQEEQKKFCDRPAGVATAIPSLSALRTYVAAHKDASKPFSDLKQTDWYTIYVLMLTPQIIDPALDASSGTLFSADKPVSALDMERWMSRIATGQDPATPLSVPGATLTKKQGVQLLKETLTHQFEIRAARHS